MWESGELRTPEEAADVASGAKGLFCLPHLMGERGPDSHARGAFVGLTLWHKRKKIARAVLEGTFFQIGSILEAAGVRPNAGVASDGLMRSGLARQMLADILGFRLRLPYVVEAGALGAVISL